MLPTFVNFEESRRRENLKTYIRELYLQCPALSITVLHEIAIGNGALVCAENIGRRSEEKSSDFESSL